MVSMKLVLLSLAAFLYSTNALTEEPRECSRSVCKHEVPNGEKVKLQCGGAGEVIRKIKFASVGTPTGTCPFGEADDELWEGMKPDFEAHESCDLGDALKYVSNKCKDEAECSFNVADMIPDDATDDTCSVPLDELYLSVHVECGSAPDPVAILTALVIVFIGLGLGTTVSIPLFKEVFREHKRAVFVGFASQFGFMPLMSFIFAKTLDYDPMVAVGLLITGASPGGTTSNLFTYYAKGNVALSIVMSGASTICALFMFPLLMYLYMEKGMNVSDSVDLPYLDIIVILLIAILPVFLGIILRAKWPKVADKVETGGSVVGVIFIAAALVTGILDNPELMVPSDYPYSWIAAAAFQPLGCLFGYTMARLVNLGPRECRAVCLETGIQNYSLAIAIVAASFVGCERQRVLTFIMIAAIWYLINSMWIVPFLRFYMAAGEEDPVDGGEKTTTKELESENDEEEGGSAAETETDGHNLSQERSLEVSPEQAETEDSTATPLDGEQ